MWKCLLFSKFLTRYELEVTARKIKQMGFDGVDLPVRPRAQITHETAKDKLTGAALTFRAQGLAIPSIVVGFTNAFDEHAEEVFAAAQDARVKMMRLGSWRFNIGEDFGQVLDRARADLESIEKLAEKYEVKANFQIHSGNFLNCNCAIARMMLQDRNPEYVGVQLDPGHLHVSGETTHVALAAVEGYIHSVNVKSPRFLATRGKGDNDFRWTLEWPRLREGLVDWAIVLLQLKAAGYDGDLSLHCEYPVANYPDVTTQWAIEDLQHLRRILAATRIVRKR